MKSHPPLFTQPAHLLEQAPKSFKNTSFRRIHAFWLAIATGVVLLIVILFVRNTPVRTAYSQNQQSAKPQMKQLCHRDRCRTVELAVTESQREIGLMNRSSLDEKAGMLFIFETTGKYPFWMKNTLIPLDIIWMDDEYKIVSVQTAQPCTVDPCRIYDPLTQSRYVLELNA